MRLAVSEQSYASGVESLVNGNGLAAQTATGLAGRLRSYAGMAGNDSTATDFAASYDEAAAASVQALESTVGAFGVLARMVEASLTNHAHAEARSTLPGWARAVVGPPTVADRSVGVLLAPPPSSLGADDGGPGGPAGMVLDLLQDVFWPNADTDRVRAAAAAWTTASVSVGLLSAHCDAALSALDGEHSPEIPIAVAVLSDVRVRVEDLSDQLGALGSACYEYADQVDAKRSELLSLLEDLVKEFAIGAIIAGGLSFLSGGAAAGAAGSLGAARIASASSRARGILDSLRVLTAGSAVGMRPVAVTAGEAGGVFGRIREARVLLMEASGQGAARGPSQLFGHLRPGWLDAHEGVGHTITKHVGRTLLQLRQRLIAEPGRPLVSTFRDKAEAERGLETAFRARAGDVEKWLASGSQKRAFSADVHDIGSILVRQSGELVSGSKVRFVLIKDSTMPQGWRLLSGFPDL